MLQYYPSVAAHDDGFVVTWRDESGSSGSRGGSGHDIFGKIFTTKDGATLVVKVDEFRINATNKSGTQSDPSVTELADGGFCGCLDR